MKERVLLSPKDRTVFNISPLAWRLLRITSGNNPEIPMWIQVLEKDWFLLLESCSQYRSSTLRNTAARRGRGKPIYLKKVREEQDTDLLNSLRCRKYSDENEARMNSF